MKKIKFYHDPEIGYVTDCNENAKYLVRYIKEGQHPCMCPRKLNEIAAPGEIQAHCEVVDFYFKTKIEAFNYWSKVAKRLITDDEDSGFGVNEKVLAAFINSQENESVELFKWEDFENDINIKWNDANTRIVEIKPDIHLYEEFFSNEINLQIETLRSSGLPF